MTAIFPAFERELPGADDFAGSELSRSLKQLDRIAAQANVIPLTSFIDSRTMYDDYLADELDISDLPNVQWHDAGRGLETVRVLLTSVTSNSTSLRNARELAADLRRLEELLIAAQAAETRFHLLFDI